MFGATKQGLLRAGRKGVVSVLLQKLRWIRPTDVQKVLGKAQQKAVVLLQSDALCGTIVA